MVNAKDLFNRTNDLNLLYDWAKQPTSVICWDMQVIGITSYLKTCCVGYTIVILLFNSLNKYKCLDHQIIYYFLNKALLVIQ